MLWLYLALLAYFINAIVFIIDKHLLAGHMPKYHAYAFGVAILSFGSVFLIPFGVNLPDLNNFLLMIGTGVMFFIGLVLLYKSIKESDVSIATTQVGTMGAIFTYLFSVIILKDALSPLNSIALLFLILGIFLLGKIEKHILVWAIFAGILFGMYYVLLKFSFNAAGFVNGLFWTRMGFVGSAFVSLIFPHFREEVKFTYDYSPLKSKTLFVFNKLLAAAGFIIFYFAINLGNVSLVNGLLGIQFLLTFVLALFLGGKIPGIREKTDRLTITHKLSGILAVLIGFLILFVQNV
ncbi:MAG: EamA family transporter [Candidatus Yanofskybacteria bacterium]|nr:EamA family transporter [Candidatus Yanofskybacteria bacterium]